MSTATSKCPTPQLYAGSQRQLAVHSNCRNEHARYRLTTRKDYGRACPFARAGTATIGETPGGQKLRNIVMRTASSTNKSESFFSCTWCGLNHLAVRFVKKPNDLRRLQIVVGALLEFSATLSFLMLHVYIHVLLYMHALDVAYHACGISVSRVNFR